MGSPYVGEIRLFAGNFAPLNWAFCNGQTISIPDNEVLFALIGTTYGGDGVNTYNLPDLRGRVPIHQGTGAGLPTFVMGQASGTESVTLTTQQIPSHSHTLMASTTVATLQVSTNNLTGAGPPIPPSAQAFLYTTPGSPTPQFGNLDANTVAQSGGSQPHNNLMPFLCLNYIISLFGIFPTQN